MKSLSSKDCLRQSCYIFRVLHIGQLDGSILSSKTFDTRFHIVLAKNCRTIFRPNRLAVLRFQFIYCNKINITKTAYCLTWFCNFSERQRKINRPFGIYAPKSKIWRFLKQWRTNYIFLLKYSLILEFSLFYDSCNQYTLFLYEPFYKNVQMKIGQNLRTC